MLVESEDEAVEAVLELVAGEASIRLVTEDGDGQYVQQLELQEIVVGGVEAGADGRVECA